MGKNATGVNDTFAQKRQNEVLQVSVSCCNAICVTSCTALWRIGHHAMAFFSYASL